MDNIIIVDEQSAIDKRDRNKRADRQEEQEAVRQRQKGNLAYRIDREIDTITFTKEGKIFLTDCKFTDSMEFIIDKSDVAKGLDIADTITSCLIRMVTNAGVALTEEQKSKIKADFRVDMWFPRTRQLNNRRYIEMDESDRGCSIKATKTSRKITTTKVKKGGIVG